MPIREVVLNRDARAPRGLPPLRHALSSRGAGRAASVVALVAIDVCAMLLAAALVPPLSGLGWFVLWPGLSRRDVGIAGVLVVAVSALAHLYGRRYVRHDLRRLLTAWMVALVLTLVVLLFVDPLGIGSTRVRSNLSVIPRNNFSGDAFETVDLHLSKDVRIGAIKLSGIAEVFNLTNHAQFTYNTLETSSAFGARNGSAGSPRSGQLAFRVSF